MVCSVRQRRHVAEECQTSVGQAVSQRTCLHAMCNKRHDVPPVSLDVSTRSMLYRADSRTVKERIMEASFRQPSAVFSLAQLPRCEP